MKGNAYFTTFKYRKPDDQWYRRRFLIVLEDDRCYIKGIDLQYLTLAQGHRCLKEIPGNWALGRNQSELVVQKYDFARDAIRCFRRDRMM